MTAFTELKEMGETFGFSLPGESNPGCGKLGAPTGVDVPSCAAWRVRRRITVEAVSLNLATSANT